MREIPHFKGEKNNRKVADITRFIGSFYATNRKLNCEHFKLCGKVLTMTMEAQMKKTHACTGVPLVGPLKCNHVDSLLSFFPRGWYQGLLLLFIIRTLWQIQGGGGTIFRYREPRISTNLWTNLPVISQTLSSCELIMYINLSALHMSHFYCMYIVWQINAVNVFFF